jgi:hypothetical protein
MVAKDKDVLNMWDRKILKKVYGPVTEKEVTEL